MMGRPQFPVAIVGMGFRFPGNIHDALGMWNMLSHGRCCITKIPASRWPVNELEHSNRSEPGRSVTFAAGVLSDIDKFDAAFFGISPREAAWLDPQQRLLLEMAYEAMEEAGPYVMPEHRRNLYKTVGGTPFLDGAYTVFGEVLEGMEVVDAIAGTATDMTDKPVQDIRILKIKIIK